MHQQNIQIHSKFEKTSTLPENCILNTCSIEKTFSDTIPDTPPITVNLSAKRIIVPLYWLLNQAGEELNTFLNIPKFSESIQAILKRDSNAQIVLQDAEFNNNFCVPEKVCDASGREDLYRFTTYPDTVSIIYSVDEVVDKNYAKGGIGKQFIRHFSETAQCLFMLSQQLAGCSDFVIIPPSINTKEKPKTNIEIALNLSNAGYGGFSVYQYFNKKEEESFMLLLAAKNEDGYRMTSH